MKKKRTLEQLTQDRVDYAAAVLAGCTFEKWCAVTGKRAGFGAIYATRWCLTMPAGSVHDGYRTRRDAVKYAIWFLEKQNNAPKTHQAPTPPSQPTHAR